MNNLPYQYKVGIKNYVRAVKDGMGYTKAKENYAVHLKVKDQFSYTIKVK